MPSVFSIDGKIFYFNCIRIKFDGYTNCYRLIIK